MELRHLKYFVAVAEELHFGRAARRVHIAQPPLSQQIRQLENELGIELFNRSRHSVSLTSAGKIMLPYAREILAKAGTFVHLAQTAARGDAGVLTIGFVDEAVHFIFPWLLDTFKSRYPEVELILKEMHSHQQLEALEQGAIDFGFGYSSSALPSIKSLAALSGEILLALPANHELATRKSITLSQCQDIPFVFPVRDSSPGLYDFMLSVCHNNNLIPKINYTAEHVYTVMGMVRAGMGVSLFPAFLQSKEWPGITFRSIKGKSYHLDLHFSWNQKSCDSAAHNNFISMVKQGPDG